MCNTVLHHEGTCQAPFYNGVLGDVRGYLPPGTKRRYTGTTAPKKCEGGTTVFGENVRWLRKMQGLSQTQLAAMIRINHHHPTPSYISRIEHGTLDPRLSTVRSIAKALRIKPWQLIADLSDNVEFWHGYLDLTGPQKRDVQHLIKYYIDRRGR